jgi:osmotically-inducible protein OsmY
MLRTSASVDKGVVTLTGYVGSFAEKTVAVTATQRIKGVRGVADEIEVRYASDKKTADDQIAQRALDILKWDTLVPSQNIRVTVRDGLVTLSGSVDWYYQRKSAEDDVRKLSGVRRVVNNIAITPRAHASDVKQKIEEALKRRAEVETKEIRVTVREGNNVLLEGSVDNLAERSAVETAAWSVPGVKFVGDRLTVL